MKLIMENWRKYVSESDVFDEKKLLSIGNQVAVNSYDDDAQLDRAAEIISEPDLVNKVIKIKFTDTGEEEVVPIKHIFPIEAPPKPDAFKPPRTPDRAPPMDRSKAHPSAGYDSAMWSKDY